MQRTGEKPTNQNHGSLHVATLVCITALPIESLRGRAACGRALVSVATAALLHGSRSRLGWTSRRDH
ncbi:hypothetical protein ON010_g9991 [Phytophthora cinnamomi]|nr:hypothetical protein ON010_g9991 [Phytophthora cinnamomi]